MCPDATALSGPILVTLIRLLRCVTVTSRDYGSVHNRSLSREATPVATRNDAVLTHGIAFRRRMISVSSASEMEANVTVISSRSLFFLQCTIVCRACTALRPNACQTETTLSWPVAARTVMLGGAS